jgi:uncharacterized protein (DUF1330 family)
MHVENRVHPDAEQVAALQRPGADGPIVMLNLLKFRARAAYPDGRADEVSGREAFARYGMGFAPLLHAIGGRILFSGEVSLLAIGQADDLWDAVALAEYPSRAAFFQLATSPEYLAVAVHREAGLAGQLLIETAPGFGGFR